MLAEDGKRWKKMSVDDLMAQCEAIPGFEQIMRNNIAPAMPKREEQYVGHGGIVLTRLAPDFSGIKNRKELCETFHKIVK